MLHDLYESMDGYAEVYEALLIQLYLMFMERNFGWGTELGRNKSIILSLVSWGSGYWYESFPFY